MMLENKDDAMVSRKMIRLSKMSRHCLLNWKMSTKEVVALYWESKELKVTGSLVLLTISRISDKILDSFFRPVINPLERVPSSEALHIVRLKLLSLGMYSLFSAKDAQASFSRIVVKKPRDFISGISPMLLSESLEE